MTDTEQPTLTHTSFPVTGQPIRVIMIDGDPWFATADVCRILGRDNPSKASKLVDVSERRTVNTRRLNLTPNQGIHVSAAHNAYPRGNPALNLVSESGLYKLIMRSDKPTAKPFQQWVTTDLLPSIRRGDADLGEQRQRMAETFSEALGDSVELVARIEGFEDGDFQVLSDGSVRCIHGRTEVCVPNAGEDSGPPFGPFFRCPEIKRVGIRGAKGIRPCGSIRFVDLIRRLTAAREPETPADLPFAGQLALSIGQARVHGSAAEIALLLKEMGIARP